MPGPLAPALIAAGANIIGGGLSAWQSRRNVKDTNRANVQQANIAYERNKELAQYTFDKNLEMWKMQNQYNTPGAQMQRLQEAGLNPHLMYGKGTVGNAQAMPTMQQTPYVAPRMDYSGRQSTIGTMAQAGLGTVSQMVQLQRAKEQLAVDKVNTEIRQSTALAETLQKQDQQAITWYQKAITNLDYTTKKYGLDGADQTLKVIFMSMLQGQGEQPMEFTQEKISRVLSGITITKDVTKILTQLGLGHLISKAVVKKNPTI